MAKFVIVDDHALFRIGLVAVLKRDPMFDLVGEYASVEAVKQSVTTWNADLVLVDISMGKGSGMDVIQQVREHAPRTKVVILSGHREEFYVVNAIEKGIDGYIHKDIHIDELLQGLHKVLRGEKFYSVEITNLLINNIYTRPQRGLPYLTKTEKHIIKYLMDGHSSKEIAAKLNVSPRTVETHRANVLSKFNLKNTTELIRKVLDQQISF
jgi:two-component system nitrate/nitrite response regulator NarL